MERCSDCGKERELFATEIEQVTLCDHCLGELKTAVEEDIANLEAQAGLLPARLMACIEETLDELVDYSDKLFHIFEDGDHDAEVTKSVVSKVAALRRQFDVQVDIARDNYLEDIDLPTLEKVSTEFYAKLEEIKKFFGI